jgi:16S rRNA (guanine527-N7)-methyltransferase
MTGDSRATAAPPADSGGAVAALFGDRAELAVRYAEHLGTSGVERGLIGPHEVPRLWDRHLLNCAAVGEWLTADLECVDVGSGAGLPGIVLAIARPNLTMTLVEPLARRVTWLEEVVGDLGLVNVEVVRSRAEDLHAGGGRFDVALARAVAPLERLAGWCVPLLRPGGRLLAIKGRSAEVELEQADDVLRRLGAVRSEVTSCGGDVLAEPTTVIVVEMGSGAGRDPGGSRSVGVRVTPGRGRVGRSSGRRRQQGRRGSSGQA